MMNEKLDLSNKRMGEFLVKNIFDVKTTKGFDKGNVSFETSGIEFIGRTNSSNGLQGFVKPIMGTLPNQGNTISISQIGAQTAQYRKNTWYSSQNIFILLDKVKVLNENVKLYFITVLNKNLSKYSGYSSFPSLNDIKNTTLTLPIKEDGTPDYEWMDQYISQIKKDYITSLKEKKEKVVSSTLKVANIDSYILTEEEKLFLDKWRDGLVQMGEFLVGDLLEMINSKYYKGINDEDIIKENGNIPFITTTTKNNGVAGFSKLKSLNPGGVITYSDTTTTEAMFYQKNEFIGRSHVIYLMKKDLSKISENQALYFITLIKKAAGDLYSYGNKFNKQACSMLTLTLPIKEDGTPDYEAMEQYILIMKKLAVKRLNNEYQQEISKTEQIVINN